MFAQYVHSLLCPLTSMFTQYLRMSLLAGVWCANHLADAAEEQPLDGVVLQRRRPERHLEGAGGRLVVPGVKS